MRSRSIGITLATVAGLIGVAGSSATAAPPDCTVPGDYPTIQAAINDPACETITVAPGQFNENLSINRQLTLDGAGSGASPASDTIVMSVLPTTPVVNITAGGASAGDRLVLSDLRLTGALGAGGNADSGVRLHIGASGFTTFDNITSTANTGNGIAIDQSAGSTVTDVEVTGSDLSVNGNSGFRVPTRVTLDGLDVSDTHFDGNLSTGLTMFGNLLNATIDGSTFNENGGHPAANAGIGISAHGFDTQVNTVDNLAITGSEANRNTGTHPTTNVSTGIQFSSRSGDQFSDITIVDTEMNENGRHGLRLEVLDGALPAVLDDVTVRDNQILRNGEAGITSFSPPGAPTNVHINLNNIYGNGVGIANTSTGHFDAECNWWGHATGPAAADNTNGMGDAVVVANGGTVDFRPWSPRLIGRGQNPEASCNIGAHGNP